MRDLPQISEAEFEVMKIVWKHAPISTNAVSYTHLYAADITINFFNIAVDLNPINSYLPIVACLCICLLYTSRCV